MRIPLISTIIDLFKPKKQKFNFNQLNSTLYWQISIGLGEFVNIIGISHDDFCKLTKNLDNLNIHKSHKILSKLNKDNLIINQNNCITKINEGQALLIKALKDQKEKNTNSKLPKKISQIYNNLEEIKNSLKWIVIYFESNLDALRGYSNFNEKSATLSKIMDEIYNAKSERVRKKATKYKEKLWKEGIKESFNVDKKAYYEIANKILNTIKAIEVKYDEIAELLEQYRVEQFKPIQMWSFLFP